MKCVASEMQKGDLVLAATSGIHQFTIGYVDTKITDSDMIIRGIGEKKPCRISNEIYYKIPKDLIGKYEILEGSQYRFYQSICKALSAKIRKLHSIDFDGSACVVNFRKSFTEDISDTVTIENWETCDKKMLEQCLADLK
jgi:hypothetical protein